ncbi:ABC transporter substrate-binding protein [uncultured Sphaerochaeta sp.]|uniref:ABC transporter substrate-binding protein n=1 Tax=uncultured Sphaerochaeta sp. TaxID=886478 RepID=UPI002A0A2AB8|nr:ABC transporter substrate-binding protein [uncultured Sphaerochaeta sp.]
MKKSVLVLIVVLVLFANQSVFSAGKSEVKDKKDDQVTLRFSWWGGDSRHEAYIAAVQRYMEMNPNVKIIVEYSGWDGYREKLYTQLAGGNAPQIFQNHYSWLLEQSEWAGKEVVKDLSQYKDYLDFSIYPESLLKDNVIFNNKILALPSSINADAIVANKALLDSIGFDYDKPMTFDDFFKYSKKLKEISPDSYFENGMAAVDIHMYWFLAYLVQKTGKPFETDYTLNYTEDEVTEAFAFIKRYFDEGVVEPLGTLELYTGNYAQNPKWVNGKSAILYGMLSTIENYVNALGDNQKNATVIPLPVMTGAKDPFFQTKVGQVFSIAATATDQEAIEAAKFLNWFNTDKEAGTLLKLSRGIPVSQVQNSALSEAGLLNPLVVKAMNYATQTGQGIGQGSLIRNNEISRIGADLISMIAFNKTTPREAAKEYIKLINKKLQELNPVK